MNYVSWFIVLYFVASYIRLYPVDIRNDDKKLWNTLLVLLIIVDILSVLVSFYVSLKIDASIAYYFVTDSNTLLALMTGISAFMVFKNLNMKYSTQTAHSWPTPVGLAGGAGRAFWPTLVGEIGRWC